VKRSIVSFLLCICLFFVAGCVTVSKYTTLKYTPTDANKIEVYSTSIPKKEYIELAEISCLSDVMKLKEEAAKLGADAIIITGTAGTIHHPDTYNFSGGTSGNFSGVHSGGYSEQYGIRCIAIKFR
jgi:hypothetical protein